MARLICLANSWRGGGRCVAGIDLDSGRWVRPIPPGDGPFFAGMTLIDGRETVPLDIVEIQLGEINLSTRYQRENREIKSWDWELLGCATTGDVMPYRSDAPLVLHNRRKVVEPALLEKLPPSKWRSLELIHVTNARFERDQRKPNRWNVRFSRGRGAPEYHLPLSDPRTTARLNRGEAICRECLLTVSLTQPIEMARRQMPPLCYKVVATVIEVG